MNQGKDRNLDQSGIDIDAGIIVDEDASHKSSNVTHAIERVSLNDSQTVRDMFDFRSNKLYAKCNFTRV